MKTLGSPPRGGQPRAEILNPFGIDLTVARVAGVHELARRMWAQIAVSEFLRILLRRNYRARTTNSRMPTKWQVLPSMTSTCQTAWKWRTRRSLTQNTRPNV